MTVGAIVAKLRVDMTEFRQGLDRANALLEKNRQTSMQAGVALGAISVALLLVGKRATAMASEFESAMRDVNTIVRASEEGLKELSQAVLEMAGRVAQAPDVLARALYNIASSGFSGAEALKVLEAAAVAATAGLTDTATSAEAVTGVLNAYGMSADKATYVADVLFACVERGVLTFSDLAQNIGQVISTAAQANVPLEELSAALATMTRAGIQVPEAVTSINRVILSFVKPTDQAKEAAKVFGIELNATALATKGLGGVIADIAEKLNTTTDDLDAMTEAGLSDAEALALIAQRSGVAIEALAELFPEIRGLRGVLVLASQGGKEFSEDIEAMANAAGASARAFAQQSEALKVQWAKTWAGMQAQIIQWGTDVLPVLKGVGAAITSVLTVTRAIPAPVRMIVTAVAALTAVLAALTSAFIVYNFHMKDAMISAGGLAGAMRGMVGTMAAANVNINLTTVSFAKLGAAAKAAGASVLSSMRGGALGIGIIVVGITMLTQAFVEAQRKGEEFTDSLIDIYERAEKVGVAVRQMDQPGLWDRMMWAQGYLTKNMERILADRARETSSIEEAEKALGGQEARQRKIAEIQAAMAKMRGEQFEQRMKEIDAEEVKLRTDLVAAQMAPAEAQKLAYEWAATARMRAEKDASNEIAEMQIKVLDAQGNTHQARMQQIDLETQAMVEKYRAEGRLEEGMQEAQKYRTALIATAEREAAKQRIEQYGQAAEAILSNWGDLVQGMREGQRLTTAQYVQQLRQMLDMIENINVARKRAGETPLFTTERLDILRRMQAEQVRLIKEQEDAEKRLADLRKEWAAEELAERRRLYAYERSMIDLTFQHKMDLQELMDAEDEGAKAAILREELEALRERREETKLDAQSRMDSLQRERDLVKQLAAEDQMPSDEARAALEEIFQAMQQAQADLRGEEEKLYEVRRAQHKMALDEITERGDLLRDDISKTETVFSGKLKNALNTLETGLLRAISKASLPTGGGPAIAGAVAGGGRTVIINIEGRQVEVEPNVQAILDVAAQAIEREHVRGRG